MSFEEIVPLYRRCYSTHNDDFLLLSIGRPALETHQQNCTVHVITLVLSLGLIVVLHFDNVIRLITRQAQLAMMILQQPTLAHRAVCMGTRFPFQWQTNQQGRISRCFKFLIYYFSFAFRKLEEGQCSLLTLGSKNTKHELMHLLQNIMQKG